MLVKIFLNLQSLDESNNKEMLIVKNPISSPFSFNTLRTAYLSQINMIKKIFDVDEDQINLTLLKQTHNELIVMGVTKAEEYLFSWLNKNNMTPGKINYLSKDNSKWTTFQYRMLSSIKYPFIQTASASDAINESYYFFYTNAIKNQIQFRKIQWLNNELVSQTLFLHFMLQGTNIKADLLNFLLSLANEDRMIILKNYVMKVNDNKIYYQLNILVSREKIIKKKNFVYSNPKVNPKTFRKIKSTTFSIESMQLVGLIENNHINYALLLLPNSNLMHVKQGDRIAKEELTVVQIAPQEMKLRDKNGNIIKKRINNAKKIS